MSTLTETPTLGLEMVARQTLIVLMQTVNEELPQQDANWESLDRELFEMRGGNPDDFVPIALEPVAPENFHLGYRPSLIKAPVEGYPNVCTIVDRSVPADDNEELDQMFSTTMNLVVEVMVKSLDSEEEVNARVQRMADAVHVCIASNRTLQGLVNEIEATPVIGLSEIFPRKEKTAYGQEFMWQGARLEYPVKKEAAMPSGTFLRPAIRQSLGNISGDTGIDQS